MISGGITYTLEPYDPGKNSEHSGKVRKAIDQIKDYQAALRKPKNIPPRTRFTGLIGETNEPR
jgi:hypothetical protein